MLWCYVDSSDVLRYPVCFPKSTVRVEKRKVISRVSPSRLEGEAGLVYVHLRKHARSLAFSSAVLPSSPFCLQPALSKSNPYSLPSRVHAVQYMCLHKFRRILSLLHCQYIPIHARICRCITGAVWICLYSACLRRAGVFSAVLGRCLW